MLELARRWVGIVSTGAQAAEAGLGLRLSQAITFTVWCDSAGDTVLVGIEHAQSATSAFDRMGSTAYSVSSGGQATIQLSGPLYAVRPYIIAKTASTSAVNVAVQGVSGA